MERVNPELRNHLTTPVTREEINDIIFGIKAKKAPGSDDFNGQFYETRGKLSGNMLLLVAPPSTRQYPKFLAKGFTKGLY